MPPPSLRASAKDLSAKDLAVYDAVVSRLVEVGNAADLRVARLPVEASGALVVGASARFYHQAVAAGLAHDVLDCLLQHPADAGCLCAWLDADPIEIPRARRRPRRPQAGIGAQLPVDL